MFRNMSEKKGRVFLTLLGIIIGIFTFTFFMFVSQGLSNAISEQFNSLGTNVLLIQRTEDSGGTPTGGGILDTDVERVKQVVRDVDYVAPGLFYRARWEYGNEKEFTVSMAYPNQYLNEINADMGLEIESGRDLRVGDRGSVVLGSKFAKEKFSKEIQVGSSLKVEDSSFRVIGIIEEQGDLFVDNAVVMSFDDIKKVSGQDTYSVIRVKFQEGADLNKNQEKIENKLNPNKNEKVFSTTSSQQIIDQFNQIIGLLTAIIVFISSIALIVGGINVLNTMYSNVIERVNEISIMKALGATNRDIRTLFLIESAFLGVIGSFVGFMLSYLLAEFISYFIINLYGYNVPINFDFNLFLGVIFVTAIFATLFGTYPAIRASKVNPADNLKDD